MSWNKQDAISHINSRAGQHSQHACAAFTREAIEAGGIRIGNTNFAKDYGPLLESHGFTKVHGGETVRAGDIIVIQGSAASSSGHMAMLTVLFGCPIFDKILTFTPVLDIENTSLPIRFTG